MAWSCIHSKWELVCNCHRYPPPLSVSAFYWHKIAYQVTLHLSTWLWTVDCSIGAPSPFPFGRICFMMLVMRKGGESSWSGPWHLGCTLEVFHMHSYQDQFIQPSWAECFLCVFSLGLCFVCSFVFFDLFVCPHSFMFPEQLNHLPYSFWR